MSYSPSLRRSSRWGSRRVAVSGVGVVSSLGCNAGLTWSRLLGGSSGIDWATFSRPGGRSPNRWACGRVLDETEDPIGGLPLGRLGERREQRRMARFAGLAAAAAGEALDQAGWRPSTPADRERTGTIVGAAFGPVELVSGAAEGRAGTIGARLSAFSAPSWLPSMAASLISIRHGLKGPIMAPAGSFAAGLQAIGDAARLIRTGEADVVVCGGAEACLTPLVFDAFAAARALSPGRRLVAAEASRPFDRARDGFVMSEGAAILVLEDMEHALARGALPLAELIGFGATADAHHITAAPSEGEGAQRAMRLAMGQAGAAPNDVGYLNAHATSTTMGDASELAAIRAVFGKVPVPISSTKGATGHLLGAAGALEAIFTILALRDQQLPMTLNLHEPDPGVGEMDLIRTSRSAPCEFAMTNSFGFGGVNASAVFAKTA